MLGTIRQDLEARTRVLHIIKKAIALRPEIIEQDLPDMPEAKDVPKWHNYESEIWSLGEEIRQILAAHKVLRKDQELNKLIVEFCLNKNAKRGRQPFLMCVEHVNAKQYAHQISSLLTDKYVEGHALNALLKMKASGFADQVQILKNNEQTWIRKLAIKYLDSYSA